MHTKKFVFNLLTSKVSASIKINYPSLRLYSNLVPKGFNVYQDTYKNEPWGEIFHWILTITSWFLGRRVMQAASKDTICCHCFFSFKFWMQLPNIAVLCCNLVKHGYFCACLKTSWNYGDKWKKFLRKKSNLSFVASKIQQNRCCLVAIIPR